MITRKVPALYVTPGPGYDIELKAKDMLASSRTGMNGGEEWFDTSPELAVAALMGSAGRIKQKLHAVAPNQVGQILKIARAGTSAGPIRRNLGQLIWQAIVISGASGAFIYYADPHPLGIIIFPAMAAYGLVFWLLTATS